MKGKILIVDDDKALLSMLHMVLKSLNHSIKCVTDGKDAIEAAKKDPFDLILMDVRIADIDGIEALQSIKKFNPSIPIIIMTAYSSVDKAVDVRIIVATNKNLEEEVKKRRFREDLFYRLNVINIKVPPLRERKDDIPLLVHYFLRRYSKNNGKSFKGFTPMAMDVLTKYRWPGNVRELENAVERAIILSMGQYISEKDLPSNVVKAHKSHDTLQNPVSGVGRKSLDEIESVALIETLKQTKGNKTAAAKILNITRTTLNNKIKKYKIEPEDFLPAV